ncbi:hypothetical protein CCMA1212_009746 [Trichoderma ghanense]|uniref:Uncharacterized protein n=1 Tax=Trichoderma ghanense TaxID=65468 RepID=A0ABY2GT14_9HYPO
MPTASAHPQGQGSSACTPLLPLTPPRQTAALYSYILVPCAVLDNPGKQHALKLVRSLSHGEPSISSV